MPVCPRCGFHFSNSPKICNRKVAKSTATQGIPSVTRSDINSTLYQKIFQIIAQQEDETEFTTTWIAKQLGIDWGTNNDKILKVLAVLICQGEIIRTNFDTPKDLKPTDSRVGRGHKYIIKKRERCPYLLYTKKKIKGKEVSYFTCTNKEWIEEKKGE